MKREKKNLVPTDDGNVLITVLPDEIKSPKMTAEWEMALNHIAQNTETADEFLNGITELMQELVARYQGMAAKKFLSKGKIHYKDLVSRKTGRQYEATVEMVDPGEGNVQFNLIFPQR